MSVMATFNPAFHGGVTIAVTSTSGATLVGFGAKSLVLTNTGATDCYVRVSVGSSTADATDYLVLAGSQVSIGKPQDSNYVAAVTASGTTTLHVIPGEGF